MSSTAEISTEPAGLQDEESAGKVGEAEPEVPESQELAGKVGSEDTQRAAKRPRYNNKAFGDLSVNELEGIVREATALKRQCEKKDEELAQLKEVRTEKAALAKQVKSLENDLESKSKEAEKLQGSIKDQDEDVNVQADRIKKALEKTLAFQMQYQAAFKEQLQAGGREISAVQANVSSEVVKALGLEHGSQVKYSTAFFGKEVTRTPQGKEHMLVLARNMTVNYYKTPQELRLTGIYTLQGAKKPARKKRASTGGASASARDEKGGAESEEDPEEEATAEGAEEQEEAVEDIS